jgi:hypothetical protein
MLKNKPAFYFHVKVAHPPQMPNTRNEEIDHSTPASIIAVALVQFLGSLPFLYVRGITFFGAVLVTHDFAKPAALIRESVGVSRTSPVSCSPSGRRRFANA